MDIDKWRVTLANNMAFAKGELVGAGEMDPLFCLYLPDGSRKVISVPFYHPHQKDAALKMIEVACIAYEVDALGTLCEAWSVSREIKGMTADEASRKYANLEAAGQPDRVECVYGTISFYGADDKRQILGAFGKTIRGADKKVIDLEIDFGDGAEAAAGRMAYLLGEERAKGALRQRAKVFMREMGPVAMIQSAMKWRDMP